MVRNPLLPSPIHFLRGPSASIPSDQIVLAVIPSDEAALSNNNGQHEAHAESSTTESIHSFEKE